MFSNNEEKTYVAQILPEENYIPPEVNIAYPALAKMKQYVEQSNEEIGWLAYVEKDEESGAYTVTNTVLFEQEVTAVTTDLDEDGLMSYANELIQQGRIEELSKVRCWGHSHVNMSVTPSGTDEATFEEYYKNCDFFIRIIANKKGELRLDIAEPKRGVKFTNVKWGVLYPKDMLKLEEERDKKFEELDEIETKINEFDKTYLKQFEDSVKNEIKDKVKSKTYKKVTPIGSYSRGYNWDSYYDYGYYDDDYNNAGFGHSSYLNKETEKELEEELNIYDYCTATIYKNTDKEDVKFVDEIFTQKEIDEIVNDGLNRMKKRYKWDKRFAGYKENDWEDLYDAVSDYYIEVGTEVIAK